jgi:poly(A) polymerase
MKVGKDLESLDDNNIFRGLDNESILSLKGRRDTDMIDKLVPEKDTFKLTLRCIKLWAKNRGVYSNVIGYLGGVTWAMLVARICIDNPHMPAYKLLATFFEYYSTYQWGTTNPVTLCPLQDREAVPFAMDDMLFRDWNKAKMPIITPSFPNSNSSFNIMDSTKEAILTELEKGAIITKAICEGQNVEWKRLFKKFSFF